MTTARPPGPPGNPPGRRSGPGLRPRLTALATVLVAGVSALLLWLGWLLVGGVAESSVPAFPAGGTVRVGGVEVEATQVGRAVGEAARTEVLRAGLIAFPLVVLAAAVVSWVLVGRVLAPLHAVTATARRLSAESLDERIALRDARGEVAELAEVFDAMLDRLQAAFDGQRRFVANASHELRTPLAVLRTEVDVTLADPDADVAELRRMAGVVREATRRADELVGALLLLARAQAVDHVDGGPVDLAELAASAVAAVSGEAAARGLRFVVSTAPAHTAGDPVLLARVTGNLLENAVRHNVAGGWVEVTTAPVDGGVELRVASGGPVIPPDRVAELFEPFRRGPRERTGDTPGSGLGLSIVRAVVLAHGGTVRGDAVPGGGLAVTVRLPAPLQVPVPLPRP
ncbi:MAG: HAMP domain-containing histidine kinase [Pseudonocardia sp.]|uniref:sensor histidine kinase n=1 Tax=unclassified Pseudonocardia TaxID=2619320 RepID=UPI00086E03E9|nr:MULTISPECIES: HAMP domain-containing sensor histidine kinase [unclassified Pseudonocardia]MBN9107866.1 HAMP domain-containing histidine kinase [Pseudonocardia sp.]ODV07442.1 MAG: two-component sensor histidine kinase [Pseudonocardia sp. SCN 73-27]